VAEVLTYPRAGFFPRLLAALLDWILVLFVSFLTFHPHFIIFLGLIYFSAMWTWRGTTVGGIILGLKVTREDGNRLTLPVAIVRALAGVFSVALLGLGFIWIVWDREKQGWHDRIAGTVVLRLPRGNPLLSVFA
jgi:uncharacterized RDD family membrane protein YckC